VFTSKQVEAALQTTLDKVRADIVKDWADAPSAEKREELWQEQKAIERIEETLRNDFASIIERAAHGPAE
jgi:hypothetical protein